MQGPCMQIGSYTQGIIKEKREKHEEGEKKTQAHGHHISAIFLVV